MHGKSGPVKKVQGTTLWNGLRPQHHTYMRPTRCGQHGMTHPSCTHAWLPSYFSRGCAVLLPLSAALRETSVTEAFRDAAEIGILSKGDNSQSASLTPPELTYRSQAALSGANWKPTRFLLVRDSVQTSPRLAGVYSRPVVDFATSPPVHVARAGRSPRTSPDAVPPVLD